MRQSPKTQALPLLPSRPRLALVPNDRMQFDLDRILCVVPAVALAPIVAHGVREDLAGTRETGRGDAAADFGVTFEAVLCVLVPEVECAVAAGGAEGAVDGVEGYGVHGVDFCDVARRGVGLAVAFEGEVEAGRGLALLGWRSGDRVEGGLPGVLVLDVLNRAASFNRTYGETRGIAEAAHYARLPFQRAGNRLVDLCRICQVDHVDVSLCRCDDEQLVLHIHAIHALLSVQGTYGFSALQIPELDALVPGASRDVVFAARLEPAHALDGLAMCFCLLRGDLAGCGGGAEVNDVKVAGRIASSEACAVLGLLLAFHVERWHVGVAYL